MGVNVTKRILVTGSRDWPDYDAVLQAIREAIQDADDVVIIHGGARGADDIADRVCEELDLPTEAYPAQWEKYGRAAGRLRNKAMVELGADVCLAFPFGPSRGTRHCMREAKRAGIPVINYGTAQ